MKKLAICTVAATMALGLAGCQPGSNTGGATASGAVLGGVLGGAIFGSAGAIIGGAVLGGIVGNQIGQSMDRRDRQNMQSAIVRTPVGQEATWTNTKTNTTYQVRPVKSYHKGNRYCREFQTRSKVGGEVKKGYGTACRQPDGAWKIVR